MDKLLNIISNNRIFMGLTMIIMNIGGKYISMDVPQNMDKLFTNYIVLRLAVMFAIFFMATHDIKISLLLTLFFIILFKYILNEKSLFCCI